MASSRLWCLLGTIIVLVGCPTGKKSSKAPSSEQVQAASSSEGILKVKLAVNEKLGHGQLFIKNIPDGAALSCTLNQDRFDPCADDVKVTLPDEDGEHVITVVARSNRQVVAVGETHFEIGRPSQHRQKSLSGVGSIQRTYNSDLTIEVDPNHLVEGRPFQDGMAIRRTNEVAIKFHFPRPPLCEPEIRCTTDRTTSKFAPLCDLPRGKTFRAHTMAKGLQFLKIQATCGDKVGEPLSIFWYGVPEDYAYMRLDSIYFEKRNRHVFHLMNPSDCPENLLGFECRYAAGASFGPCRGAEGEQNVVSDPPTGFAIRGVCNGTPYQLSEPSET